MSEEGERLLVEHETVTRRWLLGTGALGAMALKAWPLNAAERPSELAAAVSRIESYMTPQAEFRDVSRGRPLPHTLPAETKQQVGLTRDSWKLNVISDEEHRGSLALAAV